MTKPYHPDRVHEPFHHEGERDGEHFNPNPREGTTGSADKHHRHDLKDDQGGNPPVTSYQLTTTPFFNDVKRYILLQLGYPNIEVELCDEQLDSCIRDVIDEFRRYMAVDTLHYWRVPLQYNQAEYDLPVDCMVVRDICTVSFADFDNIFNNDVLVNPIYLTNQRDAYADILTFWVAGTTWNMWKRVYGLNPSWDVIDMKKRIRVYPTPGGQTAMIIKGTRLFKYEEIDNRALGNKVQLFRRMNLAYAKGILGRVRGKRVSGINTSQGVVQLDGDTLRQEAAQELTDLRKDLILTGGPSGFYTG